MIAFEVALQLQVMGEKVGMVALIDAADSQARPKAWHHFSRRLQNFSSTMLENQSARFDRRALTIAVESLRKAKNLGIYLLANRLKKMRDEVQLRLLRHYLDHARGLPWPLRHIPVRSVYLFAERCYRPTRSFDGELLLFRDQRRGRRRTVHRALRRSPAWLGRLPLREECAFTMYPEGTRACSRNPTCEFWRSSCNYPSMMCSPRGFRIHRHIVRVHPPRQIACMANDRGNHRGTGHQYWSTPIISAPRVVLIAREVHTLIEFLMKRTESSPMATFTPPECRLRDP